MRQSAMWIVKIHHHTLSVLHVACVGTAFTLWAFQDLPTPHQMLRISCCEQLSCACASTLVPSDDTVIRAPQAHRSPAFVPAPVPVEEP